MKKHYRSENNCLNCETIIPDKFCPSCGQENLELHENFLHLVLHSVGHYFHFESKFFNSIVPLLTKPGYLTKAYFAGKRASHLNPVSMYIFISILFFSLFTANTNSKKKDILKESAAQEQTLSKAEAEKVKAAIGSTASEEAEAKKRPSITIGGNNIITNSLQKKLREVMDDDLSSELFKNKLISHLPKVMFILLPLFALILKLVSFRSRKYYTEHLIYSIHVHSFIFLFGSILILLKWALPFLAGWILFSGFVVMLWYIYRSMRTIYRSTRWRTVYKLFLLGFAYTILLFISSLTVVIATLFSMEV